MQLTFLEIGLVAALATYRWTLLLNNEHGPFDVFTRLRSRLGVKYDPHSNPIATNGWAEMILCPFCLSVWVGIGVGVFVILGWLTGHPEIPAAILFPFALSGVTVYLKKAVG